MYIYKDDNRYKHIFRLKYTKVIGHIQLARRYTKCLVTETFIIQTFFFLNIDIQKIRKTYKKH